MASGHDERAPETVGPLALADALLFQLVLRGPVRQHDLRAATGAAPSDLDAIIATLEDEGTIERRVLAGTEHVALTSGGRARAAAVVAAEGTLLRSHVAALDDEFRALNGNVKQILLRWQVRVDRTTEVLNDHSEARYDSLVLADLRAAQLAADRLLERLVPLRVRYADLRRRLREALARAAAGDRAAVAGVAADSFHTAWWELHGDLLAILGRARGASDV